MEGEYLTQTVDERNNGIMDAWFPWWVNNAFMNYQGILNDFQVENCSISAEPKQDYKTPAVVIGSGPSLDEIAPLLGKWKGGLFCAASNANIPLRWGRRPDYIGVFDGGDVVKTQLTGYDWKGVKLVTHPSASPVVINWWKEQGWKRRYYCMMHKEHNWFEKVMPLVFGDFPRAQMFGYKQNPSIMIAILNAGCVVNNLVQIARWFQYDPIFLCGVDFSYQEKKQRCTTWKLDDEKKWKAVEPPTELPKRSIHMSDNGKLTTEEQIEYKHALLAIWKIDRPQLFDCSDGIITEIPKADFKEVVETNGQCVKDRYIPSEEINRRVNRVFARQAQILSQRNEDRKNEEVHQPDQRHVRTTKVIVPVGGRRQRFSTVANKRGH